MPSFHEPPIARPSGSGLVMPGDVGMSLDTVSVDIPTLGLFMPDSEEEASPLSAVGLIPGARIVTSPGEFINLGKLLHCA